jgi:hypothetical protein
VRLRGLFLLIIFSVSGCAASVPELWPPAPDAPHRAIYISVDTWHAMIAFPLERSESDQFEEWGYAERAWYLEGRQGMIGVMRALFWPTEGVVEVGRHSQLWAIRSPQPPVDLFVFRVSEAGYRRLHDHMQATIATPEPLQRIGGSVFYRSVRSYHLFHHCHHYVAHALREAGLPVSSFAAFSRSALVWQLKRAVRLARDEKQAAMLPAP